MALGGIRNSSSVCLYQLDQDPEGVSLALPGSGLSLSLYCLVKVYRPRPAKKCLLWIYCAHCPPFPVTLKALIMNGFIPAWKNMCDVLLN